MSDHLIMKRLIKLSEISEDNVTLKIKNVKLSLNYYLKPHILLLNNIGHRAQIHL